jgi:hypothetical protein
LSSFGRPSGVTISYVVENQAIQLREAIDNIAVSRHHFNWAK